MLRKKMTSPEKEHQENPLTSMSIDTDDIPAGHSSLFPSGTVPPSDNMQLLTTKHIVSRETNLPLLTAAYLSALTTGATTYAFSFYSSALKLSLHLTQSQLDTLGSATFAAGVFSWIPGLIVDRYGSKLGIIVGGMGNVCVLSLYWLIATGRLWQLDSDKKDDTTTTWLLFVLSLLGVLTFMFCALITGSVFKLLVESCGKGSKGKAVGCAKGYVGIGSGVYVCLFDALFGISSPNVEPVKPSLISLIPNTAWTSSYAIISMATAPILEAGIAPSLEIMNTLNFLLMAACLSFIAAVLPAAIFIPKHGSSARPRDGTRSIHFRVVYAGLFLLGMWVVGTSLLELKEEEDKAAAAAKGIPSSIVNKTFHLIESSSMDNGVISTLEELAFNQYLDEENMLVHHVDGQILRKEFTDDQDNQSVLSNNAWKTIRRLSSSTERHWGTAILLLLLWWGPALSLLIIPPRKESSNNEDFHQADVCNEDIDRGKLQSEEQCNTEEDTFLNDATDPNRKPMSMTKNEDVVGSSMQREFTLAEMLQTGKAWLMAWTFLVLVGGGEFTLIYSSF